MAAIVEEHFRTAEALMEALRPSNSRWWDAGSGLATHYFRGHRSERWQLLASGLRPLQEDNKIAPLFNRVRQHLIDRGEDASDDREFALRVWSIALDDACIRFAHVCERIGLPAEYLDIRSVLDGGDPMDSIALHVRYIEPHAQHHGIPTALLDWTESPLVAGYFAAEGGSHAGDPCVWAINISSGKLAFTPWKNENPLTLSIRRFAAFPNSYQRSQRGLFTYITDATRWFRKEGH